MKVCAFRAYMHTQWGFSQFDSNEWNHRLWNVPLCCHDKRLFFPCAEKRLNIPRSYEGLMQLSFSLGHMPHMTKIKPNDGSGQQLWKYIHSCVCSMLVFILYFKTGTNQHFLALATFPIWQAFWVLKAFPSTTTTTIVVIYKVKALGTVPPLTSLPMNLSSASGLGKKAVILVKLLKATAFDKAFLMSHCIEKVAA